MFDYSYANILIDIAAIVITILLLLLVVAVLRKILWAVAGGAQAFAKDILLIRLPKDRPKDREEERTVQMLHEEIAAGESIFSLIGGLKANPHGFKSWLLGAHNTFSFEIVAHQRLISFYVAAPREQRRFIEQEIYAHYPAASIEAVPDYNIFTSHSNVKGGGLKLKRSSMYPIRTYKQMDIDPLDSLLNTLAKLREHEGAAIQIIMRSAPKSWRARAQRIVKEVRRGKTLSEAMKNTSYSRILAV